MGNIHVVGPNEALIVTGGCCSIAKRTFVVGGWAWAWWLLCNVQRISLETFTILPKCVNVETSEGVAIDVECVAQCKIMHERDLIGIACEQFLGKNLDQIKSVILQTLEGVIRSVLSTLSVEEVYREQDQFATLVREVASQEIARMGFEILSLTIRDITDKVQYLDSLGKAKLAEIKRDAAVGVSSAERDAGIKESDCEKCALDVKYIADSKIEESNRSYLTQKCDFESEVNSKKADAKLAYELQSTVLQQKIAFETKQIELIEKKKSILLQESENAFLEKKLYAQVNVEANAKAYEIEMLGLAKKVHIMELAEAEAARIKLISEAEAYAIDAKGNAEAEMMRMKASAYKQFEDAAILSLTLEHLPKIAAEIAAPLAKTDEIVLLSGEMGNLSKVVSQVPPAIHALTGVDLSKVLTKVPGAK